MHSLLGSNGSKRHNVPEVMVMFPFLWSVKESNIAPRLCILSLISPFKYFLKYLHVLFITLFHTCSFSCSTILVDNNGDYDAFLHPSMAF